MGHVNIEIKARCSDLTGIRRILDGRDADFVGEDHQRDTYFRVAHGRLKLREGTIENALIYYNRPDEKGPKQSDVILYNPEPGTALKSILVQALGVDIVVEKRRQIFFVENIKFHLDDVEHLGTFVEVEAIDRHGSIGIDVLRRQCDEYMRLFTIDHEDLVSRSYSDLLRSSAGPG